MQMYTDLPAMFSDIVDHVRQTNAIIQSTDDPANLCIGFAPVPEEKPRWAITLPVLKGSLQGSPLAKDLQTTGARRYLAEALSRGENPLSRINP